MAGTSHSYHALLRYQRPAPKGRLEALGVLATPVPIIPVGTAYKIHWIMIKGQNAAASVFTIRSITGGTILIRGSLPDRRMLVIPGFETDTNGIEVLTDAGAANVNFYVAYEKPNA